MKLLRSIPLVLAFLMIAGSPGSACTVFYAFDGRVALAASNEDWADPNTQMWFVPATTDNYGIVYFGFGRGEYPPGGVSRRKLRIPQEGITKIKPEDLYGLPQGGMNEKGLFFDGASTEVIKALPAPGKQAYDGRLEDLILRKCATVEETLKLLETYAFNSAQGQWMFADKTGDSVIIEAGDVIVRKKGNYQVMTNFLQSKVEPAKVTCPRYKLVTRALAERKDLSVDLVRSLLKATAQQSTTYSTIFDLTNGEVYVHHRGDFDRTAKINLKQELSKGERALRIDSLFEPEGEKPPDGSRPVRRGDPFAGMAPYVGAAMNRWEVPGLAIAVVKDGETVLARGYGVCEVGKDREVRADTAFPIASCAKPFLAAAVAMLVEEGKLRWDDPVAKHLPAFELSDRYLTEHVTVRDLLSHRTGLRRADLLGDGTGFDAEDVLRRLKYLEPAAELRTRLIYNNHMYTALGEVVRRVSGRPWEQFVAERVFRPLDMKSTTSTVTDVPPDRLALRHWRSDAGIVARPADKGIHSTAGDMANWLKLQLAEGTYGDRRLLKAETVREMHALQCSVPIQLRPPDNPYAAHFYGSGLGWFVEDYRGRKVVLHGGAWGAMVAMIPEERLGVVVLSNLDLESLPGLLMYDVFDAYLVGPDTAWDRDKWEKTWLRNEPPGHAYRPRDEAKARLEKARTPGTKPSLPLEEYAGAFDSPLYGRLVVRHHGGRLSVTFGEYTTDLSHWQDEAFYVRGPTRLTFDWLLTFGVSGDRQVTHVTIKHVGWDKDEKDQLFVRGK